MADEFNEDLVENGETFRPRRPQQPEAVPPQTPMTPPGAPVQFKGLQNAPPEFLNMLKAKNGESLEPKTLGKQPQRQQQFGQMGMGNGELKELLESQKGGITLYDTVQLPSKGQFYDGVNGPLDGVLSIRPMTGEEEQILATQRFVRKGQAINMILAKCIKENNFKPENLLTIDRTYLLIYLRIISHGADYSVELKCPECTKKFSSVIDLDSCETEHCPSDFGPILVGVMPRTGYEFTYRLSTGRDEQEIQTYRDNRVKMFGDATADDTLIYRTAQLLDNIKISPESAGIRDKRELQTALKSLPIQDVAFVRNQINEPPFGTEMEIPIVCPACYHEFEVELPMEASFFFPRQKKGKKTQA